MVRASSEPAYPVLVRVGDLGQVQLEVLVAGGEQGRQEAAEVVGGDGVEDSVDPDDPVGCLIHFVEDPRLPHAFSVGRNPDGVVIVR
jgi:hypothetical protein